ncbi:hypothetical protein [Streptosporangium sp. NPDC051022]
MRADARRRPARASVGPHGWIYDIGTGIMAELDATGRPSALAI